LHTYSDIIQLSAQKITVYKIWQRIAHASVAADNELWSFIYCCSSKKCLTAIQEGY